MKLNDAAKNGDVKTLAQLLEKGGNPNKADKDGDSPVDIAAQEGKLECLRLLLEKGGDLNKAAKSSVTPVYIAAHQVNSSVFAIYSCRDNTDGTITEYIMAMTSAQAQRTEIERSSNLERLEVL